jgi:hypothetical protein
MYISYNAAVVCRWHRCYRTRNWVEHAVIQGQGTPFYRRGTSMCTTVRYKASEPRNDFDQTEMDNDVVHHALTHFAHDVSYPEVDLSLKIILLRQDTDMRSRNYKK